MATASLDANTRAGVGKGSARSLRRSGKVPAIIYGRSRESQALAIGGRELDKLLQHIAAESTVVELTLDGKMSRTLIREIQRDPIRGSILHVDFQELIAGEAVSVSVPLVLVGIPEGVRTSGGVLDQIMRELEIEVDPANIPNHIDVDVSELVVGHALHVRDITLPQGVEVLDDADATICVVSVPKVAVEETPVEGPATEAAAVEPELIRKPKAEEAGGEEE
jgi:large subunit ribosomal protein L25